MTASRFFALEPELERSGWDVEHVYDICWLDCEQAGHRKEIDGKREICLCLGHAYVLEGGVAFGDYDGAPLPEDSRAVEWPWRELELVT